MKYRFSVSVVAAGDDEGVALADGLDVGALVAVAEGVDVAVLTGVSVADCPPEDVGVDDVVPQAASGTRTKMPRIITKT